MKLKYFSLIFSISGILILYLISKLSQPALINISEMHEYEGKSVTIKDEKFEIYKWESILLTIDLLTGGSSAW